MKIQNLALRLLIIFTISVAVVVMILILYRAIKTNFKAYPEELLLKTSSIDYLPKSSTNASINRCSATFYVNANSKWRF